jgi:hypothetical protein
VALLARRQCNECPVYETELLQSDDVWDPRITIYDDGTFTIEELNLASLLERSSRFPGFSNGVISIIKVEQPAVFTNFDISSIAPTV